MRSMLRALLLVGLSTNGGWIFLVLASASLAYTALLTTADREAPYAFFRQLVAVAVAGVLLYGYHPVDLTSVTGNRLTLGSGSSASQGAAPLPTFLVDSVGSALTDTAKTIVASPNDYLIPMLTEAVHEATANPANLADRQVMANLSIWRRVAAAAMQADSTLAQAIQHQGLFNRLQNPVPASPDYSSAAAVAQMNQVVSLLDAASQNASQERLVCENGSALASLAADYGGAPWVSNGGCADSSGGGVTLHVVGDITLAAINQATAPAKTTDTVAAGKAAQGVAAISRLISDNNAAITQTTFGKLSDVYRALGAGAVVSSAVQVAHDDSFKVLLGEQCTRQGVASCLSEFAAGVPALGQEVDSLDARNKGWWSRTKDWFQGGLWRNIGGTLAYIVGCFMTLFAKLVAVLTPFGIAMARAVAIILSILGIYLLLLPGRVGEGIKWMIGPIAWAHVWGVLFIFWWKISEAFLTWGRQVFWDATTLSGDGISGAAVIQFVVAVGYTSLPVMAWHLVFSMPERLMPRGGVGAMISPATRVITAAIVGGTAGRWLGMRSSGAATMGSERARPPVASILGIGKTIPSNQPTTTSRGHTA